MKVTIAPSINPELGEITLTTTLHGKEFTDQISREIYKTKDTVVKKALIALGWTPPVEQPKPEDATDRDRRCSGCGRKDCKVQSIEEECPGRQPAEAATVTGPVVPYHDLTKATLDFLGWWEDHYKIKDASEIKCPYIRAMWQAWKQPKPAPSPAPAPGPMVPDKPGFYWRESFGRLVPVEVDHICGVLQWRWHMYGGWDPVTDDKRWRGPCVPPKEGAV